VGAMVLIGLGLLFLLHTVGWFEFGFARFWPLILIFLGGWLFARRWGLLGEQTTGCQCERCRSQCIMGPVFLFTIGVLLLLQSLGTIGLHRTWPVLLLVMGGIKLMQSNASTAGHVEPTPFPTNLPPPPPPPNPVSMDAMPVNSSSSEVNRG